MPKLFEKAPEDVTLFVVDSHRPYHLANVWADQNKARRTRAYTPVAMIRPIVSMPGRCVAPVSGRLLHSLRSGDGVG